MAPAPAAAPLAPAPAPAAAPAPGQLVPALDALDVGTTWFRSIRRMSSPPKFDWTSCRILSQPLAPAVVSSGGRPGLAAVRRVAYRTQVHAAAAAAAGCGGAGG